MMRARFSPSPIFLVSVLFLASSVLALDWHRGILQIDHIDPGVQVQKYGATGEWLHEFNQPFQMSELAQFRSESEAVMYFRSSTGMSAQWKGPGKFSIDRFEHSWPPSSLEAGDREYTRAILYLGGGYFFINAEQTRNAATLVIETPLGKVLCQNAVFAIDLENFTENEKKNCTLYCFSGSVSFEGHDGAVVNLSQGNKLSLLLKEGLLKVTAIILGASDRILWDQFKRQSMQFDNPYKYPEVAMPSRGEELESDLVDALTWPKDHYFMPVLPATPSFNQN